VRKFDDRERVACAFAQHPAAGGRGEPWSCRFQELGRRRRVERCEPVLGQAGVGERAGMSVAGGDEQRDAVGLDAPRDKRQHGGGGLVELVGVVDSDQQWGLGRHVAEQVQDRHGDAELLRCGVVGEAEGRVERSTVRRGEARGVVADRS
jgi:hypothetical protein